MISLTSISNIDKNQKLLSKIGFTIIENIKNHPYGYIRHYCIILVVGKGYII